ncbi:hypothetical protein AJ79_05457 [Helicocarpus griseus UAMH5409]|uniref:Aminoglycoside phosphotransferase domain-containing protein n=1 Tax=Helicocarpus griseus UAMH5409 TaxID=1447875 RepID=A0A2B7XNH9_9EURO|nr:hypothetical protein AJ79_05457 [Helicocarpus griseus UAMH5409]
MLYSKWLLVAHDDPVSPEIYAALCARENNRCCVSKTVKDLSPTFIVPPSIVGDEDLQTGGRLRPTLEALLSAEVVETLFSYLRSSSGDKKTALQNLWLMSPQARAAYRSGHIWIEKYDDDLRVEIVYTFLIRRKQPPYFPAIKDGFYSIPVKADKSRFPLPYDFLLRIHSAVSDSLHCSTIETEIRSGWGPIDKGYTPGTFGTFCLRALFALLPVSLRLRLCQYLFKSIGQWVAKGDPSIKILPLGLYLKVNDVGSPNEANALRLIEQHTTITAPKLIDFTMDLSTGNTFLLMTKVTGVPANKVYYRMTYEERRQLAIDVGNCISQYRRIPKPSEYNHLICDTTGGPITDHRHGTLGPFISKEDFLDDLLGNFEHFKIERPLSYLYEKKHDICFTHSDLHLSNLLLQGGRLSGIIDWEHAGFKPEFWEYTRLVWSYRNDKRHAKDFELAFDKCYTEELEAERTLWKPRIPRN